MKLAILGGGGFRTPLVYRALLDDASQRSQSCRELRHLERDRSAGTSRSNW